MRRVPIVVIAAGLALAGCTPSEAVPLPVPPAPAASAPVAPIAPVALTIEDFCPAVGKVYSAVWNADLGYIHYGVTAEEWATRIQQARDLAAGLVRSSDGELRLVAERLQAAVEQASAPPTGQDLTNFAPVDTVVHQLNHATGGCIEKGAEIHNVTEWGG